MSGIAIWFWIQTSTGIINKVQSINPWITEESLNWHLIVNSNVSPYPSGAHQSINKNHLQRFSPLVRHKAKITSFQYHNYEHNKKIKKNKKLFGLHNHDLGSSLCDKLFGYSPTWAPFLPLVSTFFVLPLFYQKLILAYKKLLGTIKNYSLYCLKHNNHCKNWKNLAES